MTKALSASAIVKEVAEQASRRITRKVIAKLQQIEATLSGDDSELKTAWDEICAQVQYEESFYWDAYDVTVRGVVDGCVSQLPVHEKQAIWLQTDAAGGREFEDEEDREPNPINNDDIVNYLTAEYIYAEAERWSNNRIRTFIELAARRD